MSHFTKLYIAFICLNIGRQSNIFASADAISEIHIRKYINECGVADKLNKDLILEEIEGFLNQGRKRFDRTLPLFSQFGRDKIVVLNGFEMHDIHYFDLALLSSLTSLVNSFDTNNWLFDARARAQTNMSFEQRDGKFYIQRECNTAECQVYSEDLNLTHRRLNLSQFNTRKDRCNNILCAVKQIFGSEQGPLILYALIKYKSYLSPYNFDQGINEVLPMPSLYAILTSYLAMPKHLHERTINHKGFFLGHKLFTYGIYANAGGIISHHLSNQGSLASQAVTFFHELGHRSGIILEEDSLVYLHKSQSWYDSAGWVDYERNLSLASSDVWPSEYARVNAGEDLAETFNMYRFTPAKLKEISPERYEYMKEEVFQGIEYIDNLCGE